MDRRSAEDIRRKAATVTDAITETLNGCCASWRNTATRQMKRLAPGGEGSGVFDNDERAASV
jgi:hypothetical protein